MNVIFLSIFIKLIFEKSIIKICKNITYRYPQFMRKNTFLPLICGTPWPLQPPVGKGRGTFVAPPSFQRALIRRLHDTTERALTGGASIIYTSLSMDLINDINKNMSTNSVFKIQKYIYISLLGSLICLFLSYCSYMI